MPRSVRLVLALVAALVLWLVESRGGRSAPGVPPPPPVAATSGQGTSPGPAVTHPEIGFRDLSHLAEHFQKHGAEFGGISESEYLVRAQTLRDRPAGGNIREAVRRDGVITRFDRGSGDFLAFDPDLKIRTFFRPNDGEAYFDRQLKRGQSRS